MILLAHLLDAPTADHLRSTPEGAIVIDEASGKIVAVGEAEPIRQRHPDEAVWATPEGTWPVLMPGLIDVHAHLPQYPAVARREASLLPWLLNHIFPLEKEFTGAEERAYIEAFFDEVIASGLTTIVLYSAIWQDTTDLAFQVAAEKGIRAVIGKVMMDVNSYGDPQSSLAREKSLQQTRELIETWHGAEDGRLEYAVSPRFAVTCSMALMAGSAALAAEFGTYLQTHLSENLEEIETVAQLFPDADSYTDVYRRAGLLGEKTILGHAVHLATEELDLLAASGSKIAHCPTSNFFLNSGIMPIDQVDRAGVTFGLASDVAGGPELNPWQVMRSTIEGQKARSFHDATIPEMTPTRALHLATVGGADVLGKAGVIGRLEPGLEADLLLVDLHQALPLQGRFTPQDLSPDQILSALIYRGHPRATLASFVRGRPLTGPPISKS